MKIGFLSVFNFGSNIGGVENHIYFMARALQKRGHEIIIFQPIESTNPENEIKIIDGIKICLIGIRPLRPVGFFNRFNGVKLIGFGTAFLNKAKFLIYRKRIAKVIREHRPDIIHQHDFISNIFTTKAICQEIPCVLTNHTGEYLFFQKSKIGRYLLKKLLSHFRYIIGPSRQLTPLEYNENSKTIHNGVDSVFFNGNFDKGEVRKRLGFKPDEFIILCPRRWAPTKGVIYLMRAVHNVGLDSKFRFLFAGSDYDGYPGYREEIMKTLGHMPHRECVILLGNLSVHDIVDYYRAANLVVIPSLMEAVSLAAIESMACGTPVLSTNVGGMPELIKNGKNGLMVNPADPSALADSIRYLSRDTKTYQQIARKSIQTAARYSWDGIAEQTEDIYEKALDSNPKKATSRLLRLKSKKGTEKDEEFAKKSEFEEISAH